MLLSPELVVLREAVRRDADGRDPLADPFFQVRLGAGLLASFQVRPSFFT
jgi:hypothetical protein